ncbi:MAG: type II toxin-antitoxin system PemK/MazF family toxin [Spirochaetota bacterium]
MQIFEPRDVVTVPFPYTDRPVRERRPALIVSSGNLQTDHGLLWVLLITSQANRGWAGDVPVSDLVQSGLPAPSVVRTAKLATIEAKGAERIGILPVADWLLAQKHITARLLQGVPGHEP